MSLLAAWTLCLASILAAIWLGDNEHFFDACVLGAPVTFIIGALWAMRFAFAWACSWVDSLPSPPPPPEPPTNRRARRDSVYRPQPPQPPPVLEQDAAWHVRSKTGSPPVPRSSSPSPSPRPRSDLDLAVQRFIFGGPSYGPVIPVTSCPFGIRPARSARPEFPVSRQEGPKKTAVVFSERQLRFWADIRASAPRTVDVLEDASRPQWSPPSNEGASSEGLQSHVRSSAPPAVSLSPPAPSPPAMPLGEKSTQLAETQRALDLAAPEVAPAAPSLVGRVYPPNTWVKDNRSEELFRERTRWHYDMTTRWCLQDYSDQFEKLAAASRPRCPVVPQQMSSGRTVVEAAPMPLSAPVTAAAFEPTTVDTSEDFLATDVAMAPVGGGLVGMSASSSGLVVPSFAVAVLPVAPPPVPQTMDCSPPDPAGLSPEPSLAPASSAQPPPAAAPVFPALAPAPVFSTLPSASALSAPAPAPAPAPMISFSSVRTSGPTAARRMGTGPSSSRVVHRAAPSPSVTTLAKQDWSLPDDHLLSLKPATWGMTDAQLAAHPGVDLSLSLAIASRHERYNALAATKIKKAAILLRLQMLAWDATGIQTDKKLAECLKGLLEDAAEDFATPPPGLAPDAVRDFAVAIVFLWNQVVLPLDGVLGRYAVDRFGGPGGAHWFGSPKADIRAVGAGLGLPLL